MKCPAGRYGFEMGLENEDCSDLCHEGFYCPEGSWNQTVCGSSSVFCPTGSSEPTLVSSGYYSQGLLLKSVEK